MIRTPMAATEQVTLNVDGMTCAGCQAHVQEALAGKAGVTEASVNLLMKRAAVTFDPSVVSPEALVEAVRESGYEASLPDSSADVITEQEARDRAQEAEYRSLRLKAIVSGAAAAADDAALDAAHGGSLASRRHDGRSVHALGDDQAHAAAPHRDAVSL